MDVVGEVVIGNKIYSARYGEPPRAVQVAAASTDGRQIPARCPLNDSRCVNHAKNAAFVTTDLDEWPSLPARRKEPDYINLRHDGRVAASPSVLSKASSGGKVFTNAYGHEENIYEEINELQKKMDVLDEVTRVHMGHNAVLSQLNLDLEEFLEPPPTLPATPDLHSQQDASSLYDYSSSGGGGGVEAAKQRSNSTGATPVTCQQHISGGDTRVRPRHLKMLGARSKSSVSFTMPPPTPLAHQQSESRGAIHRNWSFASTSSTSSSASSHRSPANAHAHGQQTLHGWSGWTEKCSHLLGKRARKSANNKDRKSEPADQPASLNVEPLAGRLPGTPGDVPVNGTPPVAPCLVSDNEKTIYEDVDEDVPVDEWSKCDGRIEAKQVTQQAQRCRSAASDDYEHWPDFDGAYTDDDDVVDVESAEFDVASEDSSKSSDAPAKGLRALLTGKSLRNKLRPAKLNEAPRLVSPPPVDRRFSRFFSLRRSSDGQVSPSVADAAQSPAYPPTPDGARSPLIATASLSSTLSSCSSTLKNMLRPSPMPLLLEEEEIIAGLGLGPGKASLSALFQRRYQPPMLPPAPADLSAEQMKRRCIVATVIHSENSYVASLQRLVNDYKKPLEESNPPIISGNKIATLFHRIPEILQCHTVFRLALSECARAWDRDEKIGDVFMANFSKAVVLDIYSEFINSFSQAIDLAKQESKRKSAFADFLKVKQYSSHDRLSFFGLMVKPVQRFPQFILLLQDLLKHTPHGHPDRMSLQLALTQLESLAELLNERKREAEQYQAFRDMLKRVSGKLASKPLADKSRYLLRQDDVHLMEFTQGGMISKTKDRRLLLLNDLLVCVAVNAKSGQEYRSSSSSERLALKWAFPVADIEVNDTSASPALSRFLSSGGRCSKEEPVNGVDSLCQEMNKLMHDYDVISRTISLVETLHKQYEGVHVDSMRNALSRIQQVLQAKDDEMSWVDSCCLELIVRNRSGKEDRHTFQMESPDVRKSWIIELRLAQLALDPRNSPSWDVPEQERRPSTKMPLYVKSYSVFKSDHFTEARCGCFYAIKTQKMDTTLRWLGPRLHNICWIVTSDGISSHVTLLTSQQPVGPSLKETGSFSLVETKVTCVEFSPGDGGGSGGGDLVWMGTDNRRIILYSAVPSDQYAPVFSSSLPAAVVQLRYHHDQMFVGLANGTVAVYRRSNDKERHWELDAPAALLILGKDPVVALLPIGAALYVACGSDVFVLSGCSGEAQRHFSVQDDHRGDISAIAHSGIGLWIALRHSSTICLYHAETFRHLQDINVASNVNRLAAGNRLANGAIHVTALKASKGLLWVGTNVGIVLSIPLPRLEGVPIISGRANVSYHAHTGPVNFFLGLHANCDQPSAGASPVPVTDWVDPARKAQKSPAAAAGKQTGASVQFNTLPRAAAKSGADQAVKASGYTNAALTLPRSRRKVTENDIFGLYEQLMTVKDCDDSSVERTNELCRSDPDLAAIPAKVTTLDRRLRMKMSRPRSLDLSNWSVESRTSLHTTSSSSDDGAHNSSQHSNAPPETPSDTSTLKSPASSSNGYGGGQSSKGHDSSCRTIFTLSGGRGYAYFDAGHCADHASADSLAGKSHNAYVMLWEMKL